MGVADRQTGGMGSNLGRHLRSRLVLGLLVLIPVVITYVLIRWLFDKADSLLQPVFTESLGREIPGLGLVSLVVVVYVLGLVMSLHIGRRMISTIQGYLLNLPLVGNLYGPAKQLVESFSGESAAGFKRVVVVEYPKQGTWMIGFLTGVSKLVPGTTMGIVYLPTAPTPNSGWVAMIPLQQVFDTTMTVQEAMAMVLSGGISSPPSIDLTEMGDHEAAVLEESAAQQRNVIPTEGGLPGPGYWNNGRT